MKKLSILAVCALFGMSVMAQEAKKECCKDSTKVEKKDSKIIFNGTSKNNVFLSMFKHNEKNQFLEVL